MVVGSLLEFGGLEEFATELAVGVQQGGQQVSVLSTCWVPPHNQYLRTLRKNGVRMVQLPKWLSLALSDWETKEKILKVSLWCLSPLVWLLGLALWVGKQRSLRQSMCSAHGWLRGQLMTRFIGPDRRKPFARLLLSWWQLRWRPDLIHIQGYTSTLLFVIDWAHSRRIPVIYEEHQTPDSQFGWWRDFAKTINKANLVVAVSEQSAQAMREVCGVTQPITTVYYMVPDPQDAGWNPDTGEHRPQGPIRVTTLARLYVTKGLTYLLECIVQVLKIHPTTQFRVYGDGELRDELMAYAEKLGLDGKQIFVGAFTSRDELPRIMAETDIFAMSSLLEGLPIALLEAMAYGRTIVATPAGGIAEAIKDGINGLLCPPRDPACLARKICRLIEDPALRRRLGRAARQSYEQGPYKPAAVCSRYVSMYQTVLGTAVRRTGAAA